MRPKNLSGLFAIIVKIIKSRLSFLFVFLLAFLLLLVKIDKPFIGHHDWNGVFFGNALYNTQKFGFWQTKFGVVYNLNPQNPADFKFYTHYPLLFITILGIFTKILGVYEWSMRLTAIFFALLSLYFFWKLTEKLKNRKTALLSSLFFILNPMFLYFGKMPVHEVFALAFIIWSFYNYFNYFQNPSKKNKFLLVLSLFLACQTIWTSYYLAPLFLIHYFFFKNKKEKTKKFFLLLLVPFFCFLSFLFMTFWQTGSWHNNIFRTLLFRMQLSKEASYFQFTLFQYLKQELLWLSIYFSKIACFLASFFLFNFGVKLIRKKIIAEDSFLLLIFAFPLIDLIVFPNLCFIHDYKLYYFLLSLPFFTAEALFFLMDKLKIIKKNKAFQFLIVFFILVFIVVERFNYLKALLAGNGNKLAYDLGLLVNENTKDNDIILIASPSFGEHLGVFFEFYSRRQAFYFFPELKEFLEINKKIGKNKKWLVFFRDREKPSRELWDFLRSNYRYFQYKDLFIFALR